MELLDLTGQRFGLRIVLGRASRNSKNKTRWGCRCDCGNLSVVLTSTLTSQRTVSCGCSRNIFLRKAHTTHGKSQAKIYGVWGSMHDRCYLPSSACFYRYGGRGITVCERWHNFENFYADMGDAPIGLTLERKDNNGSYSPENCCWATPTEQSKNRRDVMLYEFRGEKRCIPEIASILGVSYGVIYRRIKLRGEKPENWTRK